MLGCASIGDASWARPVPKNRTRVDLAAAGVITDSPYGTGVQPGLSPEGTFAFERGVSDSFDFGAGVRGIALSRMGVLVGGKGLILQKRAVEGSLGLLASGYWLPINDRVLGSIDASVPLRLGWNLSRALQLGIGYSAGIRYERLKTFSGSGIDGSRSYLKLDALRPTFGATLALYMRPTRGIHVAPTVTWETVYGANSALLPQNSSVLSGSLHVFF
jgi:hypothetical protein